MLHFIYRFGCAAFAYLKTVAVMTVIGIVVYSLTGQPETFYIIFLFSIVFFGPTASYNAWQDVGD